jgi:hypothetical protein
MPQYQSRKFVRAFKIDHLGFCNDQWSVVPADKEIPEVKVSSDWRRKHNPYAGCYFIQYEDGYQSVLGEDAFEKDYALVDAQLIRLPICETISSDLYNDLIKLLVDMTHHEGALEETKERWLPIVQASISNTRFGLPGKNDEWDEEVEPTDAVDIEVKWAMEHGLMPTQELRVNNYPESLVDRCAYLDRVISGLKDIIEGNDKYIHNLRIDLKKLRDFIDKDPEHRGTWVYQGDGYDYIRSMSNDLPVLITAHELRHLIENGETVAEPESGSAPIVPKHSLEAFGWPREINITQKIAVDNENT